MRHSFIALLLCGSFCQAAVLQNRQQPNAIVNGQKMYIAWVDTLPAGTQIPGITILSGGGQKAADSDSGSGSSNTPPAATTTNAATSVVSTAPASSSSSNGGGAGSVNSTSDSGPPGGGAAGCPDKLKGVTFNGGYNAGMFDTIKAGTTWTSFGLAISGSGSGTATADHVPMMAFASDVAQAVSIVTGDNPPDWMLTFNEPDYSYGGVTPTMSPQDAATAIQPLLQTNSTKTKFVAPVTADPLSDWVPQFFAACNCQSFFSAYNIHIYFPTSAQVIQQINTFRGGYAKDKPIWVTEVAPGNANPPCSLSWDQSTSFMNDVYGFAKKSGFVDRVFWNTGNEIGPDDHNVCNSYLLDSSGNPSPLLQSYQNENCGSS